MNHSQMAYFSQFDGVVLGGILRYPESGELEFSAIPVVKNITTRYIYDNNEEEDQGLLSDIRVPMMTSNVRVFSFVLF